MSVVAAFFSLLPILPDVVIVLVSVFHTFSGVRTAVPVVLSTKTPKATDEVDGTAIVPVLFPRA